MDIIYTPLFPSRILVSIGEDRTELLETLKDFGAKQKNIEKTRKYKATGSFGYFIDEINTCVIVFNKASSSNSWYGELAHNVYNAVTHILEHHEVYPCEETQNVYAYMIGEVTELILDNLKEKLNS